MATEARNLGQRRVRADLRPLGAHDDRPHEHAHHHGHDHDHHGHDHHGHDHHDHPHGFWGAVKHALLPHSHDAADSVDTALVGSERGIRAVKLSLLILGLTAVGQLLVAYASGSVALLADTIHNFSDAMTAVPLWIAFSLSRRPASRRFTYGFGRAEDLAGVFVILMIAMSAVVAAWQAIDRLLHPAPIENLGWVAVAGFLGFLGNEAVALLRIREGRAIGSAALVADGMHARTDGITSLAVLLGAGGVALGFPLADPIIGLVISALILAILWTTARDVLRRLLDGIDPDLVERAERRLAHLPGVARVCRVRMRWIGHELYAEATLDVDPTMPLAEAGRLSDDAATALREAVPSIGATDVHAHAAHA